MQRSKRGKTGGKKDVKATTNNRNTQNTHNTKSNAKSNSGGANSAQQIVNIHLGEVMKRKLQEEVPETELKPVTTQAKKSKTEDTSRLRQDLRQVIIDYQRALENLSPALRTPDIADVPDELLTPTTSQQIRATINWLTNATRQAQERARTTVLRPMDMQPGVQIFQPLDQQFRISQMEQALRSREEQLSELDRVRQLSRAPPSRFPTPAPRGPGLRAEDLFEDVPPAQAADDLFAERTQSIGEDLAQLEGASRQATVSTSALNEAIRKTALELEQAQTQDEAARAVARIEQLQNEMRQMETDFIRQLEKDLERINVSDQGLSEASIQLLDQEVQRLAQSSDSIDNAEEEIAARINQAIANGLLTLRDGQSYSPPRLTRAQADAREYIRLITRQSRQMRSPSTKPFSL